MKKKFLVLFLLIVVLINSVPDMSFANEKGKVILININRTSIQDLKDIKYLNNQMNENGYVGLMNIKGANGTSDIRSYASIGAGTRAYINPSDIDFETINENSKEIYLRRTGINPGYINNLDINKTNASNERGEYGAFLGAIGYEFNNNNLNLAVLGNSDTDEEKHREIALIGMDINGQVQNGNIDNINIKDQTMPFGIRTDYDKLKKETKKYYDENNLLIVELGDTYRLDLYKENLNEDSYEKMKTEIYSNISDYLKEVFKIANENDRIYITSAYPEKQDYIDGYRLSPIVVFDGKEKGLLTSGTTRRKGVLSNQDISADIFDYFGIESDVIAGKTIQKIESDNNMEFLLKDYDKIVSNMQIRIPVLYTYAAFEMIMWMIMLVAIFFRHKTPKNTFRVLCAILKFTITIPFVLLIAPLLNYSTKASIITCIVGLLIIVYFLVYKIVKDDLSKLILLSGLVALGVLIDAATGQNMIKSSLLGYDPIIGARYYGIGNEYMGVLIGSLIFSVAGLLEKNIINKKIASVILIVSIVLLGHPKMGANVGGTITSVFSFLYLIMRLYNIKIDLKKIIFIGLAVVGVVSTMAIIDIYFIGSQSHLAGAIKKIASGGPLIILQIITRKIEMNMKLIGVSIWSKVLILGLLIVVVLFQKPVGILKKVCDRYPYLAKGWTSIIVASIVGFLVNDSGVVAAATSIAYVIIPVLVLLAKELDVSK
ncbi:hypothetical protein [Tepidibacter hydrothermalis]|uniref:Alkaline phosphatase-like protein n=1 Tax=Tepidibacter hydrothermalis TaxID=3036126 RepID=A0ABY8E7D3_9FIRM|nr:hypothetical protein [Tepidibacter hydrothermalis]WFD08811.1 hypothetical protein P4S50_10415 [Tepidibacter hydrothermalis]